MPGNSRCWEFAQHWRQAGHTITFISSSAGLPKELVQQAQRSSSGSVWLEGIEIHILAVPYDHLMPFWRRLIAFLSFYRKAWQRGKQLTSFDLILAYSAPLTVIDLGRKLSLFHRKPLFLELGDIWPDVPIGMGIIRNASLIRWMYKRTDKIYAQASGIFPYSDGMAQQLSTHLVPESKITVIPNGVDPARVPFQARATNSTVRIIYTGTIGKANDLSQFLLAIHHIEQQPDRPSIHFTILGDGNDAERIRQKAQELSLQSLTILPRVSREEATQLLQSADIGIICFAPFPVLEANGATKFFDYLSSGLPVVINYRGWQAQYLQRHTCGLSSDQGDDHAFAMNILRLAQAPELRLVFGKNGRQLAVSAFSRPQLARQMIQAMTDPLSD